MKNQKQWLLGGLVLFMNLAGFFDLGLKGHFIGVALVAVTLLAGAFEVFHAALLALLLGAAPLFLPKAVFDLPATSFLIPFLISLPLVLLVGPARHSLNWARLGRSDRLTYTLMLLTALLSSTALIIWALWTDNLGVGEQMMKGFIRYSPWLIVLVGIPAFALTNAFAEEVVYRGVLQQALRSAFKSDTVVVILQASAFGAAHVRVGFPNGLLGYAMVFVYGSMLGYLRRRSQGLRAPFVTHILADLTIGYFLYWSALSHAPS